MFSLQKWDIRSTAWLNEHMCYSSSVSFAAAAVLVTTGVVATLRNQSQSQRMVAAIPLLFGMQQVSEGVVWNTLGSETSQIYHHWSILLFLTFALVIWPTWLPLSFYFVEKVEKRKKILKVLSYFGVGVSLLAASVLFRVQLKAFVIGQSLSYVFYGVNRFWPVNIEIVLYLIPTLIPFFITSVRTFKRAGYLVFVSLLLAQIINQETTTSVWCFFAAIISFYITVNILWAQRGELI